MSEGPAPWVLTLAQLRSGFDRSFAAIPRSGEDRASVILIRVAGEVLAIRPCEISGLVKSRKIVPVPSRLPELLGVTALRGALVPVYDLAALLGVPRGTGGLSWLILAPGDTPIALAFDGFEGQEIPEWLGEPSERQHVRQLVRVGSTIRALLDVRGLTEAIRKSAGVNGPAQEKEQ
jgi:purine-binding chemotaxis protein CheW